MQALRAAACLLVVAYHALDAWGAGWHPHRAADAIWPNGAAGVDLFFVISGFVMAVSSRGLEGAAGAQSFLARRLRRIVPLYWLMTGLKLAILVALGGAVLPGLWPILASLLFIPSRDATGLVRPVLGVGWTLQFEMLFYALFAAAIWAGPRWRRARLRLMVGALAPLALAGFFRQPGWPVPLVLANGLVLEFCLGLAVAALPRPPAPRPWPALLLGAAGLALLLTLPQPGPWRFLVWGLPAALMLAAAVRLEPVRGARVPRWLLAVGEASYAIYLAHPFLVPILAHGLRGLPPGPGLAALLPASLATGCLGGVALHRAVDRPVQRWLAASRRRPARALPQLVEP